MPAGLTREEFDEYLGEDVHLVYALMATWESMAILVFRGVVSLELLDDFFSGPITISWKKLRSHVEGLRRRLDRETIAEWFEWLGDRMTDLEGEKPPIPAHIAYRDWKPPLRAGA